MKFGNDVEIFFVSIIVIDFFEIRAAITNAIAIR
jgi:hypothetical protein